MLHINTWSYWFNSCCCKYQEISSIMFVIHYSMFVSIPFNVHTKSVSYSSCHLSLADTLKAPSFLWICKTTTILWTCGVLAVCLLGWLVIYIHCIFSTWGSSFSWSEPVLYVTVSSLICLTINTTTLVMLH